MKQKGRPLLAESFAKKPLPLDSKQRKLARTFSIGLSRHPACVVVAGSRLSDIGVNDSTPSTINER